MSPHLTDEQLESPLGSPHLNECQTCRAKVAQAAARRKLLQGLTPYTLSPTGFQRVEARVLEYVRENPVSTKPFFLQWSWLGRTGALAALVGLIGLSVFFMNERAPVEPVATARVGAFEPLTVVYAAGDVAVSAGEILEKGRVLDALKGDVTLATADGTSLRFQGGAHFELGAGGTTAQLLAGKLSVDAHRGGPWILKNGNQWLQFVDAAFEVAADSIQVHRGSVLYSDSQTFKNSRALTAPASLQMTTGAVSAAVEKPPSMRKELLPPWAKLEVRLSSSRVELDGQSIGKAPVSLLVPPGKHRLRAWVAERWQETDIDVTQGEGATLESFPSATVAPKNQELPEADPQAIAEIVRAQLPKLQICHEKWLKVNEQAHGKVLMTVTVSAQGRATGTRFEAEEAIPSSVSDCLGRVIRGLRLPRSSEEVELEIPINLGNP